MTFNSNRLETEILLKRLGFELRASGTAWQFAIFDTETCQFIGNYSELSGVGVIRFEDIN
jgi:hypothetical protein